MKRRLLSWFRRHRRCPKHDHRDTIVLDQWRQKPGVPHTIAIYTVLWVCVDCGRRGAILGETYSWLDESHSHENTQ